MKLEETLDFVVSFGKYRGETIRTIAESDEGLLYLDWLRSVDWISSYYPLKNHIDELFRHEPYKTDLDESIESSAG